jgi:mono/diheme cytochrome c family protein
MRNYCSLFPWTLAFVISLGVALNARSGEREPLATARRASQLYTKYCVSCHGRDGTAQTRKAKLNHARNISDAKWQDEVTDERIFNSIVNGRNVRGNMPAFSKHLTDQEVELLVSYVRGLRK